MQQRCPSCYLLDQGIRISVAHRNFGQIRQGCPDQLRQIVTDEVLKSRVAERSGITDNAVRVGQFSEKLTRKTPGSPLGTVEHFVAADDDKVVIPLVAHIFQQLPMKDIEFFTENEFVIHTFADIPTDQAAEDPFNKKTCVFFQSGYLMIPYRGYERAQTPLIFENRF